MERGITAVHTDGTVRYPVVFGYRLNSLYTENIVIGLRGGMLTTDTSGFFLPAAAGKDGK
jgi:hypothetical protein